MYFVWVPNEPDPYRRAGVPKILDPSADAATLRAALAGLTYDELVSAWHSSDDRLETETDVCRRGALVALRELILDEVERRSAVALSSLAALRWAHADPRAGPCPRRAGPVKSWSSVELKDQPHRSASSSSMTTR